MKTRFYVVVSQSRRHSGAGKDKVLDKFINGFWVQKILSLRSRAKLNFIVPFEERGMCVKDMR